MFESQSSSNIYFFIVGDKKCSLCRRFLRPGLFDPSSEICHACARKTKQANKFATRARGYERSVNNTFLTQIFGDPGAIDPSLYLQSIRPEIVEMLQQGLDMHTNLRWTFGATIFYDRYVDGEREEIKADFNSPDQILLRPAQIEEQVDAAIARILEAIEEFIQLGSDWVVNRFFSSLTRMAAYRPVGGSRWIPTPSKIAKKHCVVNVRNKDELCFLYSVAAALHPAKAHTERPSKYKPYLSELNITGLTFPLSVESIPKFEELNPDITIHVMAIDLEGFIVPHYASKHRHRKHTISLLLLNETIEIETEKGTSVTKNWHYTW